MYPSPLPKMLWVDFATISRNIHSILFYLNLLLYVQHLHQIVFSCLLFELNINVCISSCYIRGLVAFDIPSFEIRSFSIHCRPRFNRLRFSRSRFNPSSFRHLRFSCSRFSCSRFSRSMFGRSRFSSSRLSRWSGTNIHTKRPWTQTFQYLAVENGMSSKKV
jgi:hypothetical protein